MYFKKLAEGYHYSIIDKKTDGLIGSRSFVEIDNINQTAEPGIFIGDKNYWGKGYGTEALSLLAGDFYKNRRFPS